MKKRKDGSEQRTIEYKSEFKRKENSLEELKELYKIFNESLILNFEEEQPYIVIYDGYIE